MRIWIVETGEPVPGDAIGGRLWRAGLLSRILAERGHKTTWWASTFDHKSKKARADGFTRSSLLPNLELILLPAPEYDRNVSVRRMASQRDVAAAFLEQAPCELRPDLIFCCVPTLELGAASTEFGGRIGVPVVLDYRDLWPQIFLHLLPKVARPFGRLALQPLFTKARLAFSRATAITGITDEFVQEGLQHAGRPAGVLDRAFPHGYERRALSAEDLELGNGFWRDKGVRPDDGFFTMCFFGQLSRRHEFELTIAGTKELIARGRKVRLVLCGNGEMLANCREAARGIPEIIVPDWVDYPQISTLMALSKAGLVPYPSTPDFAASFPNKAIEYMSGKLPIVSSIRGVLSDLLAAEDCGFTYANGDASGFVDSIERLHHEHTQKRMSLNSAKLFEQKFRAEAVYSEFAEHLERIVDLTRAEQIA